MGISNRINPRSINTTEDLSGFTTKCEASVMASIIVKNAQELNQWPEAISIPTLKAKMQEKMGKQRYVDYTSEALKVLEFLGFIKTIEDIIVLQEDFAITLYEKFPAEGILFSYTKA